MSKAGSSIKPSIWWARSPLLNLISSSLERIRRVTSGLFQVLRQLPTVRILPIDVSLSPQPPQTLSRNSVSFASITVAGSSFLSFISSIFRRSSSSRDRIRF